MSESLKISNFLIIKKADINIKKINILIGPQANGKSVIAKLLYFFKDSSNLFVNAIKNKYDKRKLDSDFIDDFEDKFPRYSWEGTEFSILYTLSNLTIEIIGKRKAGGKTKLSVIFCDELMKNFKSKKSVYNKKIEEIKRDQEVPSKRPITMLERHAFIDNVLEPLRNGEFSGYFSNSVFIPASRSFFANLQKNIFTFLASNLEIDPFLKEFGSVYENSKRWYKDDLIIKRNRKLSHELYKSLDAIIGGDYEFSDEKDWIVNKSRRINLANASSGQQESLPMLLVLCVWPMMRPRNEHDMFFIEEPEAHLFPTSQSHIISILSVLARELNTNFFITSHSPYILSALNNFIMADDCIKSGSIDLAEFQNVNGVGYPISFEDISAYTINMGKSKDISDYEYRMIGSDMLDSISEHFENVMNTMLASRGDD